MIKTRFAVSPTGFLHVGGLRSALFQYLFAKRQGGQIVLRIEDTDQTRFVEGATEDLIRSLAWAGITFDEGVMLEGDALVDKGDAGPYTQSQRLEIYQTHIKTLLEAGHAYYAFDTKEELDEMRNRQQLNKQPTRYERSTMRNQMTLGEEETKKLLEAGEPYVVRMNMPKEGSTSFTDMIRGEVEIQNNEIDDQVLIKADGFPTYHFAVVVDDHSMDITHVIRGEEWITSTPKHIQLYKMFGWDMPTFAHLPLLVNEKKAKLSKRHGDVAVGDFKKKGYLPEALVNFVAFLGWNPGDERELFTLSELEKEFSFDNASKSAAVFNREKLGWYNQQYIRKMDTSKLVELAIPYLDEAGYDVSDTKWLEGVVSLEKERMTVLSELAEAVRFVFEDISYESDLLVWKKSTPEDAKEKLEQVLEVLRGVEDWNKESLEEIIMPWIKDQGFGNGDVLWPLRTALSGQKNSPGPFEIAAVLGKEKTIQRVEHAISLL